MLRATTTRRFRCANALAERTGLPAAARFAGRRRATQGRTLPSREHAGRRDEIGEYDACEKQTSGSTTSRWRRVAGCFSPSMYSVALPPVGLSLRTRHACRTPRNPLPAHNHRAFRQSPLLIVSPRKSSLEMPPNGRPRSNRGEILRRHVDSAYYLERPRFVNHIHPIFSKFL